MRSTLVYDTMFSESVLAIHGLGYIKTKSNPFLDVPVELSTTSETFPYKHSLSSETSNFLSDASMKTIFFIVNWSIRGTWLNTDTYRE